MKTLKREAKRKAWEEGLNWVWEALKVHMITICPKVWYAKRVLKCLD